MSELSTRDPYYPPAPAREAPDADPYRCQYPGYIDVTPAPPPAPPKPRYWLHAALYLLTIASTTLIGGWEFSASLLAILTAHEFGHYFAARRYRVHASLPYFIPTPLPPFGTMGALIRMSSRIPTRQALFDIGAAGPLAGLVVAIPVSLVGIALSDLVPTAFVGENSIRLGEPYLFQAMVWLVKGSTPENVELMLHPLAYAGWAGLFVTAFNLLPMGQLDGGHISHALSSRHSSRIAMAFFAGMVVYSVAQGEYQWTLLLALLLIFGVRHPRMYDDPRPLDALRIALGALLAIIFITCFSFTPFDLGS
jgi:membrane-associated protease RseP (regulator of RpoE activity)